MTDYKNTLNLPHTNFPMKASLTQREPEILKRWQDFNLYEKLRIKNKGKEKFILPDGPPYANGHIHIGHALDKTLKDIIIKMKSFSGFDAPYIPGWDCHGLPIEINVEKKFGKAGEKLSAKEFRAACRDYANEQINIQREEFKRLGVIGDWEHPYLTMDKVSEANVIRTLAIITANGHLLQGFKPVHWCIECRSSLAEAEVEYANKTSPAIDVRFRVIDEQQFLAKVPLHSAEQGQGPISVPIWTTTPWTLPANEAVAIHPEHDYVLLQVQTAQGPERLLLAAGDLLPATLERYGIEGRHELGRAPGKNFEKLLVQHPFYDRQVPIVLGEHVTLDAGTGAVHTAPSHGQDDYLMGIHYQLPLINPVGTNGCFLPNVPLFAGEHVFKANAHVIEVLKEKNALLHETKIEHSYPHCWRHKTALIFLATPQWFVGMDKKGLRVDALRAIDEVQWIPQRSKMQITSMVAERPDWCISRQRVWGVPLALIIHKETRALHPDMAQLFEKIAKLVEQQGIEAWYELELETLLGDVAKDYEKSHDVLDVWFDSGAMHFTLLKQNPVLSWPADLFSEGSDQHRGWFQSSLLTSVAMYGKAPYKCVLTHGFTVDDKGRKMSKSLGNVIPPEKIINSLGADILRLWVASTDYRSEIAVSDEILQRNAEAYRRLRNTTRFLLANISDFDPEQNLVPQKQMLALDRWVVDRALQLQQELIKAYDEYQLHLIYQKLHNFCITELGGFYLDIIKDRQYTTPKNSLPRRSAQTALYHIAEAMVRWLAPILSFTAEEIWQYLPGKRAESVFLTEWYSQLFSLPQADVMNREFWQELMRIRELVNKELENQRQTGKIGSALEAEIKLYCSEKNYQLLAQLKDELRFVFITSAAHVCSLVERTEDAVATNDEGLWLKVSVAPYEKCVRCWHRRADIGAHADHPEICARCYENVVGEGEVRLYA